MQVLAASCPRLVTTPASPLPAWGPSRPSQPGGHPLQPLTPSLALQGPPKMRAVGAMASSSSVLLHLCRARRPTPPTAPLLPVGPRPPMPSPHAPPGENPRGNSSRRMASPYAPLGENPSGKSPAAPAAETKLRPPPHRSPFPFLCHRVHEWRSSGGRPSLLNSRESSFFGARGGLDRGTPPALGPGTPCRPRAVSGAAAEAGAGGGKKRQRGGGKGGDGEGQGEAGGQYKATLNLPSTTFGMRANSTQREPEIQKKWEDLNISEGLRLSNQGEVFTLHDGPPYANGDLHIGHALNKILKDIINRYMVLQGRKVRYIPGWDCHGLPIELKVLQSMDSKQREGLTPIKLRKKAAQFARKTVDKQRASFKRYGVWGAWGEPYLTLDPEYEAAQIGVFGAMFLHGHIYRGRKPVHWSPSSRTALAEAELEYPEGHASRSMYARFQVKEPSPALAAALPAEVPASSLAVAIWTTTPWTIPGNAAVAVNDKLQYVVARVGPPAAAPQGGEGASVALAEGSPRAESAAKGGASAVDGEGGGSAAGKAAAEEGVVVPRFGKGNRNAGQALRAATAEAGGVELLVVAEDLVGKLEEKLKAKLDVVVSVPGSVLEGTRYWHPLDGRECPVVVGGEYITTESGTGLVHTAPGHGQEDYATGLKYGLPLLSPVDDKGHFTAEAGERFAGKDVLGEGNVAVMAALDQCGSLLLEERYEHKYPYDWRTKKPTIFRATDQWFASVQGFRDAALEAIRGVNWVPAQGEKRITAMTEDRSDWCISRQRSWGVPIPVFYHKETGEPLLTQQTLSHIQGIVGKKGSDAWYEMEVAELLPAELRDQAEQYRKGTDTMDVWFDSGSSWAAVLQQREGVQWPADLYLEGSDQHRGWFQSSLLTGIAAQGVAPYRRVLTHGFVLDERGLKMSKSLGNVVDPSIVINGGKNQKTEPPYGADVLRLWVSSVDYSSDVVIGPSILRQMSDVYRKLRGTLRFMLGNLHGFDALTGSVPYESLPSLDKYALYRLACVMEDVQRSYEDFQFFKFSQLIQRFSVVDLSNFYFDVCKDRLYVGGSDSFSRRACQTVLYHHVLCMLGAMAPVLPHLAEDAWENLPFPLDAPEAARIHSVFQALWPKVPGDWLQLPESEALRWSTILQVRAEVNKVMEQARTAKLIGANLDAKVYLHSASPGLQSLLHSLSDEGGALKMGLDNGIDTLRTVFLSSQASVVPSMVEARALGLENTSTVPISVGIASSTNGSVLAAAEASEENGTLLGETDESCELWIGVGRADGSKCERCWNYSTTVGSCHHHQTLCDRCAAVVSAVDVAGVPVAA